MRTDAARRVKREIESGVRGAPRPCFSPNESNINYQDNDQKTRDDRWLRVWWDSECLVTGQKWEDGFMDGLLDSVVAMPLISCDMLQSMSKLERDGHDNVLTEQAFCLELYHRRELTRVTPLLIGKQGANGYSNFFLARGEAGTECALPECVLPSVNKTLAKHMRR